MAAFVASELGLGVSLNDVCNFLEYQHFSKQIYYGNCR